MEQETISKVTKNEDAIRRFIHANFGPRYEGASLSKLEGINQFQTERIVKYVKDPRGFLLFHGVPGCGKTYFCASLTEWIFNRFHTRRYWHEGNLLKRLRQHIGEGIGDYLQNLEYFVDDEFVILDDVGSGINPEKFTNRDLEFRREVFLHFLDYRYTRKLPTIITSNFTAELFNEVYGMRVFSRLFAAENTIISMFGEGLDKRQMGY